MLPMRQRLKSSGSRVFSSFVHAPVPPLVQQGAAYEIARDQARPQTVEGSLRIHVPTGTHIEFTDLVLGPQNVDLASQLSNFIVRRRDGLYAYQLAAAVDDFSPPHHSRY